MKEQVLKIKISNGKILTLSELYQEYEKTHRYQAELPFEEKIKALVQLQTLAASWGNQTKVMIWKI